jgi:hypothetical protein
MKRVIFALMLGALLGFTGTLHAATVTYILGDHPDASLYQGNPNDPYGLRYDAADPPGDGPTFSVGTNLGGLGGPVTLSWDDSLAGVATLSGTLERNDDGTFWTVNYTLSGLASIGGSGGFTATAGTGSVDEIGGALRSIALNGEQNPNGYAFIFNDDGHRLPTSDDWVGRGWLDPTDSVDDWLVTAQIVPVPAAVWLFGSALGLMGFARRRRG